MKAITLDVANKVIGGACIDSFDLVNDKCLKTTTCTTPPSKYGQGASSKLVTEVSPSFCGVTPEV